MPEYLNLKDRPAGMPFSDAVIVGDTVYLSGRIGFIPGTSNIPSDPAEEARYLIEGISAVLAKAGLTLANVVSVQIFTPDVGLFDVFNRVYVRYFSDRSRLPARAFLGSGPLLFGARFEMMVIASRA